MTEWTPVWPKEEGWYWYASKRKRFSIDDKEKRVSQLEPVEVRYAGSGEHRFWMYIAGGRFLYAEEQELQDIQSLWKKMEHQPSFPKNFDEIAE